MTEENQSSAVRKHNNKWRVVDIVVAAIIAVASGVIFWGWDIVCTAPLALFEAVTPGFEGLLNAFWLFAGPLARHHRAQAWSRTVRGNPRGRARTHHGQPSGASAAR